MPRGNVLVCNNYAAESAAFAAISNLCRFYLPKSSFCQAVTAVEVLSRSACCVIIFFDAQQRVYEFGSSQPATATVKSGNNLSLAEIVLCSDERNRSFGAPDPTIVRSFLGPQRFGQTTVRNSIARPHSCTQLYGCSDAEHARTAKKL